MNKLQLSVNGTLNLILNSKSNQMFENQPSFILDQLLNHIQTSVNVLPQLAGDKKRIHIKNINEDDYTSDYLKYILLLKYYIENTTTKNISSFIHSIILHGSMATLDYVPGWSDVDIICILKSDKIHEIAEYRNEFIALESYLYQIDRHQHHGIQYITDKDLLYYTDSFYPHNLLPEAKVLYGKNYLEIAVRNENNIDSYQEDMNSGFYSIYQRILLAYRTGILKHHSYKGEYLLENYQNINTMYQLKYYLSLLMLLPVLWLNLTGIYCSKRDSFKFAKLFISQENWKIIETCSSVRSCFLTNDYNNSTCYSNKIPDIVIQILGNNYFEKGYLFVKELKDKLEKKDTFSLMKGYYDKIVEFCDDNKESTVVMCGSISEPGLSDLDFLVLGEDTTEKKANNIITVREKTIDLYMKPLTEYSGNALICPVSLYNDLPYIIDLNLTPIHSGYNSSNAQICENYDYNLHKKIVNSTFYIVTDIIEWLPERILLMRSIIDSVTDTSEYSSYNSSLENKIYLVIKSVRKSIKSIASLLSIENKVYNNRRDDGSEEYDISLLKRYHKMAVHYFNEFSLYVSNELKYICGDVRSNINICSYYKSVSNNEFGILKLYLYYLTETMSHLPITKKLSEKIHTSIVRDFYIDEEFAKFICKRWTITSQHYDWFINKNIQKGMIKWGWLLK